MNQTASKTDQVFQVGMGEIVIASEGDVLSSLGIGSCIALVIYHPVRKIAGMAHIMLPDSSKRGKDAALKPGKFADTAVKRLLSELERCGVKSRRDLRAKFAGGASMFNYSSSSLLSIGEMNSAAVKGLLESNSITLESSDTGGSKGRSVKFCTDNCTMEVKAIGQAFREI